MVSQSRAYRWRFGTTADIGIGAAAPNPGELFAKLAEGLFDLITDIRDVRPREAKLVSVQAPSPEGLLVSFLTELLYLHDAEGWVFRRFTVELDGDPPSTLWARAWGEPWDEHRHARRTTVKAITMHRLELDLNSCRARVIVDI
jgi:SHS2 domain-containing protein